MFAKRAPMVVFDLFKPEDYKAMFAKHAWTDRSEVDIDQYLTAQERIELCDYEKDRMRNIKKNYDVMVDMGLPAEKPYFMQKNRPKFLQPVDDSSESDGEWVPSKNRPRAKKPLNAGWKPPVKKKAVVTSSVKSSKVKPTKPKSKRKGKAAKATVSKPRAVSEEVVFSDSEDEDFEGFSAADVEQSEARAADILPRNEAILADIEAGTYDFDLSDDEQEESESGDSQRADVASQSVTETPAEKPAAEPPTEGRYPRRSIARKVYTEPEVPKDDHYLYCEECDHDYEGDCPVHGPLLIIHDTQVANDGSDPDRADHSLPKGLVVRKSQIPLAGDGVWCEKWVPKGARFGPYEGIKEDDGDEAHKSGYCWVIYADGKAISHYVDAGDKSQANWLRYVNCARNEGEQNLLAYQFHGEVYYRTVQEILPGQELLVWYGDEYGRELGLLGEEEGKEHQGQPTQLGQDALRKLFHDAGFELWACDVCGRVFPSEEWRDGHRRGHGDRSGSKKYVCTQCNYSTDNGSHYNRHLSTHSGSRAFTCQVCSKSFGRLDNLTSHQVVHSGEKAYQCPVCGKRFNRAGNLKTHSRCHTGETLYSCPLCEYACNDAGNLTTHMRTHTGEKSYVCDTCGQGFTQSQNLTTHMRTHTGERPYSCVTCGYRCSDSGNLGKHMRTHTGEKPYVCDTCGQGFSQSNNLKYHSYTHTGQWPHPCILCTKQFAKPSGLKKHVQRNHSL